MGRKDNFRGAAIGRCVVISHRHSSYRQSIAADAPKETEIEHFTHKDHRRRTRHWPVRCARVVDAGWLFACAPSLDISQPSKPAVDGKSGLRAPASATSMDAG